MNAAAQVHAQPLDLITPMGSGIERDATVIEIRLALAEYRARHGKGHWRVFAQPEGRA